MIVEDSPAYMLQLLSNQLPLTLKSHSSSFELEVKNTSKSNSLLNWTREDFLILKSKSSGSELSPLKTCHLLCAVSIWKKVDFHGIALHWKFCQWKTKTQGGGGFQLHGKW